MATMKEYLIEETVVYLVPGENEEHAVQALLNNEHRDKHWFQEVTDRRVIGEKRRM